MRGPSSIEVVRRYSVADHRIQVGADIGTGVAEALAQQHGVVGDPQPTTRQGGTAAVHRGFFDDQRVEPGVGCGQRAGQATGAATDDQQIHLMIPLRAQCCFFGCGHGVSFLRRR